MRTPFVKRQTFPESGCFCFSAFVVPVWSGSWSRVLTLFLYTGGHLVARTRVQVVGLVNPGWLVEVDAVAVR